MPTHTPYSVTIKGVDVDIYDVLQAFKVTNPASQHAIKKMLRAGRGTKTVEKDYLEAIASMERALELVKSGDGGKIDAHPTQTAEPLTPAREDG